MYRAFISLVLIDLACEDALVQAAIANVLKM